MERVLTPEMFGITRERGALPELDPLLKLPEGFSFYDEFGRELPDFLATRNVRKYALELPRPSQSIDSLSERERILLMVRLAFIVSAFAHQNSHIEFAPRYIKKRFEPEEVIEIPENLSVPFLEVSEKLDVPSIMSYAFFCLNNWEKFDKNGPIEVQNLRPIQSFLGGADERHFILEHTEIESGLGPAVYSIIPAQNAAFNDSAKELARYLCLMETCLARAIESMENMMEFCHPDIYYLRVRPYIFGFNLPGAQAKRTVFRVGNGNISSPLLRGETGAQTLSFPALWSFMGIQFSDDSLKHHVLEMRNYLLPIHRSFLTYIESGPSIRGYILSYVDSRREGWAELKDANNQVVLKLHDFFKRLHLYYADVYINKKARKYSGNKMRGLYGTGGTPYMEYLSRHCEIILDHLIK